MYQKVICILFASTLVMACGHDDGPISGNETEVITTVVLSFTPDSGGAPVVAVFDDPDGDGGEPPTIDALDLGVGTYALAVRFENGLEDPPEDITAEVSDESHEHQVFFTGSSVDGPASDNPGAPLSQTYDDQDVNGLPIGLANTMIASIGSGELVVTLRHLPPIGGASIKTAETSSDVREVGFSGIGGSSDAQVSFVVTVQ